ncbi:unnamed protein product [Penicillium roqueforti FM164]|uniref:Genomic scaffold, ProqFM164S01 n=1 Tax=Penicillium roqueforti (strain FM164) TaxID=1365484 RepID=W6QIG6_PENRF|nr:unnamed protein product [Penicillium roqueforti FM164]
MTSNLHNCFDQYAFSIYPDEPIFESDFPLGTDQIATLRNEPYGKERFEMEVELRLGPIAREEESIY